MDGLYSDPMVNRLEEFSSLGARQYQSADPFPHTMIDDFLPEEFLNPVLDKFPGPEELKWTKFADLHQKKLAFAAAERLDPSIREVLQFLNSSVVLQFLERLTGINGLIPDPYFNGGGLHQIERGGKLNVHVDFNKLERTNLDRRLNLLIYLNQDWKEEYGGHLELWDRSMEKCVKRILPIFNRCLIFSTTEYSFHGHPTPLNCPEGRSRKSLALYYYTNGRPAHERSRTHSTIFRGTGGNRWILGTKSVVRAILPPVITDAYRYLRQS